MSADGNRLRAGLARVTTSEIEGFAYAGSHSFTVTAVHAGGRCDLAPVNAKKFQPLKSVDQWPCVGGAVTTPVVGSIAVVEFRDWKSSQPMITRFQPLRLDGGKPDDATVDATLLLLGPTAAGVKLAGGNFPVALASLVDARLSILVTIIGQIAGKLNVAGAVTGAPGTVTLFTAASVAATKVTAQ